jgi:hypothetical protein
VLTLCSMKQTWKEWELSPRKARPPLALQGLPLTPVSRAVDPSLIAANAQPPRCPNIDVEAWYGACLEDTS